MKFLDSVKIYLKAGNGGAGSVSFRREKFIEYGGPNGGNGGKGGDVYFKTSNSLNTLIDFRYQQHLSAKTGHHGMGKSRSGENGQDLVVTVPVGTVIYLEDKETKLFDLNQENMMVKVLEGGIGGKGNEFFKSSTNQAPRFAQPGQPGQELWVWLELEIIADVGIIGMPNAGKSSLINSLTNTKHKTASYAFTTLQPNLGVLQIYNSQIVFADIPGLIEGASEGVGLGIKFLNHIKRCNTFLHILDVSDTNLVKNYKTVIKEIKAYDESLLNKNQILVLNKTDLIDEKTLKKQLTKIQKVTSDSVFTTCAITKDGLEDLVKHIYKIQTKLKAKPLEKKDWSPI